MSRSCGRCTPGPGCAAIWAAVVITRRYSSTPGRVDRNFQMPRAIRGTRRRVDATAPTVSVSFSPSSTQPDPHAPVNRFIQRRRLFDECQSTRPSYLTQAHNGVHFRSPESHKRILLVPIRPGENSLSKGPPAVYPPHSWLAPFFLGWKSEFRILRAQFTRSLVMSLRMTPSDRGARHAQPGPRLRGVRQPADAGITQPPRGEFHGDPS
jgi:hypothetical protein